MPTEFEVHLDGPTKTLLSAIRVLAEHSINLDTVSIAQLDRGYMVRFLTGSEENVRTSLMKADLHFKENKVLVVEVQNKPGQWLRVAQTLADDGVEINHSYRVGEANQNHVYAFGVSDYQKAKETCGRLGVCWAE
jgi:hypothetical protein